METLFAKLLSMSIAAGWLILAVLLLRLLLCRGPKWVRCVLWGLVGVRLVTPVSFQSALSLIPRTMSVPQPVFTEKGYNFTAELAQTPAGHAAGNRQCPGSGWVRSW